MKTVKIIKRVLLIVAFVTVSIQLISCSSSKGLFSTETLTSTNTTIPTNTNTFTITPSVTPSTTPSPSQTATATNTFTPTVDPSWVFFENKWLTLYYPPDWNIESPREHSCIPGSDDCIIHLSHLELESVEIEFYRIPPMVPQPQNVEEADEMDWNMKEFGVIFTQASDHLVLISKETTKIDDVSAIKRLYEYPLVDPVSLEITDIQYNYRALAMKGKDSYFFLLYTTSVEEFEKYLDVVDQIVSTIVFLE